MKFIKKILGVSGLLSCVFLFPGGISLAQTEGQAPTSTQQQSSSTPDLESQPNTANYPRGRHAVPPANIQPGNADPPSTPAPNNVAPSNTAQPNQNSQLRPALPGSSSLAVTTAKRPPKSTPADRGPTPQNFVPQSGTMIGPPAPVPPTLEQMPPSPPQVTYENRLLSVDSRNARLTDILSAIRAKTGIQFEGLPTGQDRVAGKFGPAPADQVLTSLLQGLHFDYVIIGMPDNPSVVQRVILTPTSGSSTAAANPGAQPSGNSNGDDEDASDDSSAEPAEPAQQQPQAAQPRIGNGPKTPEQLLEELRRMQQRSAEQNQQNQEPNQPQQNPPQNPPSQPPE